MKLAIEHIRKTYGGRDVLADCSYSFGGTGVHVLMGPNGCGKSTLLRICSLLEHADDGSLVFSDNGAPLALDMTLRRRMTLVLPRTGVFNTTVFGNVAYGLRIRGLREEALESKVFEALSFVGISDKAGQHALSLSSGETQRMGIARALAIGPEILFLDEPTASIDEENTAIVENIILSMRKQGTTMVVMTTHDRDQAARLGDRQLRLVHGRIEEA